MIINLFAHEFNIGYAEKGFIVIDTDTINVTELEPNENGELVPGNTAPFVRVK